MEEAGAQAEVHQATECLARNVSGQEAGSEGGCQQLASKGQAALSLLSRLALLRKAPTGHSGSFPPRPPPRDRWVTPSAALDRRRKGWRSERRASYSRKSCL